MNYWLMKSEPEMFSIEHLRQKGTAGWDGVRNYQARNYMRAMRVGDLAFFYHSSVVPPGIAGRMKIVREAYSDPTQFDPKAEHYEPASTPDRPRWDQVDVQFIQAYTPLLTLEAIRGIPSLKDMVLLQRSRLSVQPVSAAQWKTLEKHLQ